MRQISRFQVVPMLHKLRHWNTDIHLDPEVLTIGSIVRTALHHQNHLKSIHSMCKVKPALSMSPTRLCQNSACINFVFTATTPSLDCFQCIWSQPLGDPLQAANQESRPGHPHGNRCGMWDIGRSDPIWGGCRRGRGPCHVLRIPTGTTDAHHCGKGCLLRNLTTKSTNGNLARDGRIVATGCSLNCQALKERVNHPGNSVGSGLVTLGSLAVHGQLQQEVVLYVGHPNKRLRTPRARPEHKLWPFVALCGLHVLGIQDTGKCMQQGV